MSLYRRKDSPIWWVSICIHGKRIQQSTGTDDRKAAQEYHDKLKAESWRQGKLGDRPKHLWNDAVVRWATEQSQKKTLSEDIAKFKWLHPFLNNRTLESITRDDIARIVQAKTAEDTKPATINRYLALIRSVLRRAMREWDWIDKVPVIRLLKEPKMRVRWITPQQAKTLLDNLPPHQQRTTRFALATGLRQGNVKRIRWDQIDIERRCAWIHADDAKAGKPIPVPLNAMALEVLEECKGQHKEFVFVFRGKPVTAVNTKAWRDALKRAEIDNFRWHDLRHSWASWHIQAGTRTEELQELGGWQTTAMVRRYAHIDSKHLHSAADRIATLM